MSFATTTVQEQHDVTWNRHQGVTVVQKNTFLVAFTKCGSQVIAVISLREGEGEKRRRKKVGTCTWSTWNAVCSHAPPDLRPEKAFRCEDGGSGLRGTVVRLGRKSRSLFTDPCAGVCAGSRMVTPEVLSKLKDTPSVCNYHSGSRTVSRGR